LVSKRLKKPIKFKNQPLQLYENRIKPSHHQLIMKNTKKTNLRRKKGLFRGALMKTLFSILTLPFFVAALQAEKAPNFILIYADDLGYTQTSVPMMKERPATAHALHQTPNLDQLAAEGMRFSNAYAPSPVCTSSRASIQHGKTTARVGCISLHDVVAAKKQVDLGDNLSLAEMLHEANKDYITAIFGKGCSPMGWFKDHGYDETDFIHLHPNSNGHGDWWEPADKTPIPLDDPKRMFSLAKTSTDFLKARADDKKPFYLMISHYALHVRNRSLKSTRAKYLDIVAKENDITGGIPDISRYDDNATDMPKNLRALWEKANYAAMVENMDSSIGIVLDELKSLGLDDNTYVFFTSDNGGGVSNAPLQGGKAKMWEGGLRVPMIASGPGIPADTQCDTPVAQWDYLTTFHDLAGSHAPLPDDLDGVSLRPVLEQGNAGQLKDRDTGFVFHFPAFYTVPITAYRDGDYKLMRQLNTNEIKLFNVVDDMGETKDLSKAMPEKTADMIRKLDAYLEKVGAWTMEEVYETRLEELNMWKENRQKEVSLIQQKLKATDLSPAMRKQLNKELKSNQALLKKQTDKLANQSSIQNSASWM
jgi:arylsulfatase A-like enzyme|tara:strand:- start:328 stop:2100 length:1773 start_codon:yes stop_codon:yes gene_type:complete